MGRLGIIAASGTLPEALAQSALTKGHSPFIICLTGQCDHPFTGFETASYAAGQLKAITKALKEAGCNQLLLAGKFTRPSLKGLKLDGEAMALLGRVALRGDDAALRLIADHFARHDIEILPNSIFLPDRVMPEHYHFGGALNEAETCALRLGINVLEQLGNLDVGQSVIVQQQRVIAIEGAEGTQAMIDRAAAFIDEDADSAIFVKMAKRGQEFHLDMPVIGCQTIEKLAKAQIRIVAVEAGKTLLADPMEQIEESLKRHEMIMLCTKSAYLNMEE